MSGFSIDWLDLREPADLAARDSGLLKTLVNHLPAHARIVDLGSGTGSTLRALRGTSSVGYRWRLLDIDPLLLAEARHRHGDTPSLETLQTDLNEVDRLPLQDADLVSASALFDLVSQDFVNRLCPRLAAHRLAFYAALNYDGQMRWDPRHPLDGAVTDAFNQDQRRDKGFGPALGPEATDALRVALQQAGYQVDVADSPWQLGPNQERLARELFAGIAAAVKGALGEAAVNDWLDFRLSHAGSGHCIVGHQDILALPVS
ncbi:MAG: class I SAM-dependent methyltransferase [Pseudomonadales bacterium]|nr:class I SAM-dependent methyltransferase [Pseudomonadales bacterium]